MSTFSFRLFRRLIAGLFALAHLTSATLELSLHAAFSQPILAWTLFGIDMVTIGWFFTAAIVKPALKKRHTVTEELFSAFVMFVLSVVLSLIALTVSMKTSEIEKPRVILIARIWLRVLVFTSFSQFVYVCGFFILTGMTMVTYDHSIWERNMDGSPSPFSMTILLSHMLPFIFQIKMRNNRASLTPEDDDLEMNGSSTGRSRPNCYGYGRSCNCRFTEKDSGGLGLGPVVTDSDFCGTTTDAGTTNADVSVNMAASVYESISQASVSEPFDCRSRNLAPWKWKTSRITKFTTVSLSKSLIEIPDAVQRRMSYPVVLRCQDDILVDN
ncbi:hypothetical protein L218DRAFT_984104 [Marasmius fiardii PR-910]|nr:hypothetical protein L218DRAFT_984104 [Marasmius fiardii PR-910]